MRAGALRFGATALLGFVFGGCATLPPSLLSRGSPVLIRAERELRQARAVGQAPEVSANHYLAAADAAAPLVDDDSTRHERYARRLYNTATAELTGLLRTADGGRLWNRPLELNGPAGAYHLRMSSARDQGVCAPLAFDRFKAAAEVKHTHLRQYVHESGIGGALVGIRARAKGRERFIPPNGVTAPVTAVLDFQNGRGTTREASLSLYDPSARPTVRWRGAEERLEADFSAPLAFLPRVNELLYGLWGMIRVDAFDHAAGLYMLDPFDPDRIPVVFVHGLLSTPQMWLDVINEIEAEPELRGHFQYWAFFYATGTPVAFSAEKLRSELTEVQRQFPLRHGMVLVGHSMGGLLARMQATTTGRAAWDATLTSAADRLYAKLPEDHILKKSLIFRANPAVKRLVFICVPHRGSDLALGWIGALGTKLVRLPNTLVKTFSDALGESLVLVTGMKQLRAPTSIQGLSPKSPMLRALDTLPIEAPYHSIIGDRGRHNSPLSSDGVVPYRSSHLEGAQSECIVPGWHGAYAHPQTIAELRRILRLHLRNAR
jgi:pimeloyl-ACP methyl ester carboxylesterase